jgi:hypothetical protein
MPDGKPPMSRNPIHDQDDLLNDEARMRAALGNMGARRHQAPRGAAPGPATPGTGRPMRDQHRFVREGEVRVETVSGLGRHGAPRAEGSAQDAAALAGRLREAEAALRTERAERERLGRSLEQAMEARRQLEMRVRHEAQARDDAEKAIAAARSGAIEAGRLQDEQRRAEALLDSAHAAEKAAQRALRAAEAALAAERTALAAERAARAAAEGALREALSSLAGSERRLADAMAEASRASRRGQAEARTPAARKPPAKKPAARTSTRRTAAKPAPGKAPARKAAPARTAPGTPKPKASARKIVPAKAPRKAASQRPVAKAAAPGTARAKPAAKATQPATRRGGARTKTRKPTASRR